MVRRSRSWLRGPADVDPSNLLGREVRELGIGADVGAALGVPLVGVADQNIVPAARVVRVCEEALEATAVCQLDHDAAMLGGVLRQQRVPNRRIGGAVATEPVLKDASQDERVAAA